MNIYSQASELPLSRRLKAAAGRLIGLIHPRLAAEVDERPFDPGWGVAGKFVRNAHLAHAVEKRDHRTLRRYFTHYWSSAISAEFYDHYNHRFEDLFLRHHAVIADHIENAVKDMALQEPRLVEIGSGDGKVLEWFSRRLPHFAELHGIDLNGVEIEKCRQIHRGNRLLHFHENDLIQWHRESSRPHTVLLSNGGVLEYLLEDELAEFFADFRARSSPCVIALSESIGRNHNLASDLQSHPYGVELAFSHNYPRLLRDAGFEIQWERDRPTEPGEENYPVRWYQIVAAATKPS